MRRDAPVVVGGMGEQVMGQFDARAAAHPNALAPQGPNHACTIGNHEVSGPNRLPELWLGQRRHRHLGIEGDQLPATAAVQLHSRCQHIGAGVYRHPEHLLAVTGTRGWGHGQSR